MKNTMEILKAYEVLERTTMDLEKLDHDTMVSMQTKNELRTIRSDVLKILKGLIAETQNEEVNVEKRIRVD